MFTFFKRLIGKPQPPKAKVSVSSAAQHEPTTPMPTVEVAHLSLAAIVAHLPEEFRGLVLQQPDASSTVVLPVHTIVKQLPTGAVKLSLATLHRQAPAGIFAPIPPGDRRMVGVPLVEVFRHVSPHALKRRADQRPLHPPSSEFNLFGNAQNPYEVAPGAVPEPLPAPVTEPAESSAPLRFADVPTPVAESTPPPLTIIPPGDGQRVIAPPSDYFATAPRAAVDPAPAPAPEPAAPRSHLSPLCLPLAPISSAWPDEIKGELGVLNGSATVRLPVEEVTAGLAKGRVVFTWGQICACLEPPLATPSAVSAETPLTLPLKIIAPAFLAASKQSKPEVRSAAVAADIPELFTSSNPPPPVAAPAPEPVIEEAPALAFAPETVAPETPLALETVAPEPPPAPALTPSETEALHHPPAPAVEEPAAPAPHPVAKTPETVSQIFGDPDRQHWTPAEIVSRVAQLPGIAGAIVALQEGLLVAHSLPEDVKADVVAAFLPQIFARLNQYAGEMKLGDVDDLLFTTHGAHCQIYRLGFVFFAILGKPGESLPWHELRLIAEELAKQTQPSETQG